ncbi:MAG TPA: radical SAM protein [Candidatus Omnitrophota bacterium]|nr:radical SAM protein [Candidatus Omnitrophota bacterium]
MAGRLKILLINPHLSERIATTMNEVHEAMEKKPPLGILSVGTYLKNQPHIEVKLLDNQLECLGEEELIRLVTDYRPDIVGITVVTFKLYSAFRVTQIIKKALPSAHICWGGPHLSIFPKESLRLPGIDSVVLGDGEIPFSELCRNFGGNESLGRISGLYTSENLADDLDSFKEFQLQDLNSLPIPDLTLLPYKKYRSFLTNNPMATAISARGCPFHCIFCKLDFSRIRLLSMEKVLRQIEIYLDLGIKEVEFYDETFNLNVKRVIEFATEVLQRKLKFKWSFRGRVNAVNLEMLKLIKKAGCQRIQYGVEAGTDRVLKILKKETDVGMIRKCFALTNQCGIDTVAYFILGNPGETLEEMGETIKLAQEIKPTYLEYAIFNILPGTEAYQMALEQGILQRDFWREYAMQPAPAMPLLAWTKDYSYETLEQMRRKAVRNFYRRPGYLLKRLLHIKPEEAYRTIKTGFHMLSKMNQK